MSPGTIHEVLTTQDCIATGGHFVSPETMPDTMVWSTRMAGSYADATNATHNNVLLSIIDAIVMRRLQPVHLELKWFQEHAELSSTAGRSLTENIDLTAPEFVLWIVSILFSNDMVPRTEDRHGTDPTHELKHQLVCDHVVVFIRWVDMVSPSYQIVRTVFEVALDVLTRAQQGCTLRRKYDKAYVLRRLQLLFKVAMVLPDGDEAN